MRTLGPANPKLAFPERAADDKDLERSIHAGTEEGLNVLAQQLRGEAALASKLAEGG